MKPFISCLVLSFSLSLTLSSMAVAENFQSKTGHNVKQELSSLLKTPEQPKDLSVSSNVAADLKEPLARKAQLEQEQATLKNKIALEVSKAYTSFTANQARVQRYETQLLPYSVAVVDKSRRAFEAGKTNILAAINAQQAYMDTRLGHLQALMDYQNTISDLERAVGTGL